MHAAALAGHREVVAALLEHGARHDLAAEDGRTVPPPPRTKWTRRVSHPVLIGHAACLVQVLHCAARGGHKGLMEWLLFDLGNRQRELFRVMERRTFSDDHTVLPPRPTLSC